MVLLRCWRSGVVDPVVVSKWDGWRASAVEMKGGRVGEAVKMAGGKSGGDVCVSE